MSEPTVTIELTGRDLSMIGGALSAQLRYFQRGLDKAKEDDAIDRWATSCVQIGKVMEKFGIVVPPRSGS